MARSSLSAMTYAALMFGCNIAIAVTAEVSPVAVTVNVDMKKVSAFSHNWKKSWGSGHAALTLRDDWRKHLKLARDQLGLQGVRYHGLFDDDMGPVVTGSTDTPYNWTGLQSTWDYMKNLGLKPIVELSFMPAWLANCSWKGPNYPYTAGPPGAPSCSGHTFHYEGISQPPYQDNYDAWGQLVEATARMAIKRYGLAEVQSWSFEVWNELWGMPFPGEYMKLYNASAHALKRVDPNLKVGGPATAALGEVTQFVKQCQDGNIPFDFVSTHHYPSDGQCGKKDAWDPTCFTRNVRKSRQSVADYAYYLTEYNVGCCLGYSQHDTSAAAAFVFRQVGELNDELDVMSYWTFTDIFEEGGFPDTEFKNIYGSMTKSGIPKPVWRAFQLLHMHAGDNRADTTVSQPGSDAISATINDAQPLDACAMVPGVDFMSGDLLPDTQHLIVPNAAACCQACQNHTGTGPDSRCEAWSYGGEKSSCCKSRCYLKQISGIKSHARDNSMTSGYVGAAPPAPPPPAPKPYISAMSTIKGEDGPLSSLRVFLGFWGNPDQENPPPANRSITVNVQHAAGQNVQSAKLYIIDGSGPRGAWEAMGSPAQPDEKQLAALMHASEWLISSASVTAVSASQSSVTVELSENSAVVVSFGDGQDDAEWIYA